MAINFNAEPYYDDYDENNNFHRVLFRPGYAVQARELTQLQTILQKQISRHADWVFKDGSVVQGGEASVDRSISYVKLLDTYSGLPVASYITNLIGEEVIGQTTGIRALISQVSKAENSDPNTIFVKYITSGNSNQKVFVDNEILQPVALDKQSYTIQAASSSSTGIGSVAGIQRGIFYALGNFVLVEPQVLVLNKYNNTPSFRVGLTITEQLTTPELNSSLLDNAQGSYNYAAPGAHRYKIDLFLDKRSLTSVNDTTFIELLTVKDGVVLQKKATADLSVLEKILADRTYDESGDYVVKNFNLDVREHRNNDRGSWVASKAYVIGDVVLNGGKYYTAKTSATSGSTAPTHTVGDVIDGSGGVTWTFTTTPFYNRGIYTPEDGGDESKLALGLEPGRAYVRGYLINKTSTQYITVPKARAYEQAVQNKITATVGNYVNIQNLNNTPDVNNLVTVDLYESLTATDGVASGTKIGTARVRGIEWTSGTIGTDSAIYKLFLFDVKLNTGYDFSKDVKQFYYNGGTAATSFTADISPLEVRFDSGTASTSGSSVTVTGNSTKFSDYLKAGDYVRFGTGSGAVTRKVLAVSGLNTLTIDTAATITSANVYKLLTTVVEPQNSSLLFPFPYNSIKSVRDSSNVNRISYTVSQKFTANASSASGGICTLTIQTTGSNDTFASVVDPDNYLVTDNTTGLAVLPSITEYVTGSLNKQVKFTLPSALATRGFIVTAAVNKTGSGTEKTKSLTTLAVTKTTAATATLKRITLGKADGYKLLAVYMDGGSFASPAGTYTIDITNRYSFDDGQKDSFYDLCSILLNSDAQAPTAPIQVQFQYFTHTGPGDYFTVNSYLGTISYAAVPVFGSYSLSDVIDFRPRIDDAGSTFTGTGALSSGIPKRGIDVQADFSYYLPRKDKLSLDLNGQFFVTSGVSSLNPNDPQDATVGMLLYKLQYAPYTYGANKSNVYVEPIDNKRYTMRDIGKLEKRIDNLEYYTSLSLLEQETKASTIIDSATSLDRLKNGFIVDNFQGHGIGDTSSSEYRCSIDMQDGILRPFFAMNNVNLLEVAKTNAERTASGYQATGELITLPYTNVSFINQPYASRVENINPFAIFTFLGQIDINPPSDEWFETDRRPDLVTNVEGNFDTISALAEKAGVLGTVWNAWQTQWTGTPVSSGIKNYSADRRSGDGGAALDAQFGNVQSGSGWAVRTVTAETFATKVGQSRSGVRTTVIANIDRQVVEDKTISTAVIPYIRSRNLLVVSRGLKPKTTFYPYFDDSNISQFVTPASRLQFTAITNFSSSFDYVTNAGQDSSQAPRCVGGNSDTALNRGDVVFVKTRASTTYTVSNSPATAVVALQENIDGTLALHVVNITGTFANGDILEGSISGARGTLTGITLKTIGNSLVTNAIGDVVCLFNIPNTDAVRFRTGVREFKLSDSVTALGVYSSRGRKQYRAEGILETKQRSVIATRNAEIVREATTDERTITETSNRVISDTGWYDPLAQTFMVQSKGGAFLTKVDIFFATKDTSIPVQLEIREVVNGYPGKLVLAHSRVLLTPDKVNIAGTTVNVDGTDYAAPTTATSFVFPSPVYVQDATEYALVLSSDSNNYKAWISQVGELDVGSGRFISEQPYAGVFFKSQNASTWTADQTQDLKFNIYRAEFATNTYVDVPFINDAIPNVTLGTNPLQVASGSNKIRVSHYNHGMPNGSTVTLSGLTGTLNGIPSSEINGNKVISNVEFNSYVITTTTNATVTGTVGGNVVKATENYAYYAIQPIVQNQNFSDTSLSFSVKATSGQSVDGTEVPYYLDSSYSDVIVNDTNEFYSTKLVASTINQTVSNLNSSSSLFLKARLYSTNSAISPVIDMARMSAVLVRNMCDYPSATNNIPALDTSTVISANNIAADATLKRLTSSNTTTQAAFKTIVVGKYVTVSGFTAAANNGTFLVTEVASDGSYVGVSTTLTTEAAANTIVVSTLNGFVDEISPSSGTAYSKYLTRSVILQDQSTFLKIQFAADVEPNASVDVYYKLSPALTTNTLFDDKYILLAPDTQLVKNSDNIFYDTVYTLKDQPAFDAFIVKIVFRTTDESQIAKIKDLRIIACA